MVTKGKSHRQAKHAGYFYPEEKSRLAEMVHSLLKENPQKKLNGKLHALVVPHAGYIYSGPVAAFAYNALRHARPRKIFLMGPSHHEYFEGARSFNSDWKTPLGTLHVKKAGFEIIEGDREHSLEVQVPFLQTILPHFEFTPVIYGEISPKELASAAEKYAGKEIVLIASSDLSHYFPYNIAQKIDAQTIEYILQLDLEKFLKKGDACGKTGIAALIILAREKNWKPVLLDYRNSGDTAGDRTGGVVGYAAIAFVEKWLVGK